MSKLNHGGKEYEVEVEIMSKDAINVVFTDSSDFAVVYDWAFNSDLSNVEITGDDGAERSYRGYSRLKAITALMATEGDFWEGARMVVVLEKPEQVEGGEA